MLEVADTVELVELDEEDAVLVEVDWLVVLLLELVMLELVAEDVDEELLEVLVVVEVLVEVLVDVLVVEVVVPQLYTAVRTRGPFAAVNCMGSLATPLDQLLKVQLPLLSASAP